MYFVSCPKQGFEMKAVVLHRVGFLEQFCHFCLYCQNVSIWFCFHCIKSLMGIIKQSHQVADSLEVIRWSLHRIIRALGWSRPNSSMRHQFWMRRTAFEVHFSHLCSPDFGVVFGGEYWIFDAFLWLNRQNSNSNKNNTLYLERVARNSCSNL